MRPVLYAAGAFGGAAAAVMGAAVGYGTMLGTMPRECPHCAGEDGTRAPRSKAPSIASSGVTAGGTAVEEALRRKAYDALAPTFDDELEVARVPHRDQAHALVDDAAGARGCPRGRSRVSTLLIADPLKSRPTTPPHATHVS